MCYISQYCAIYMYAINMNYIYNFFRKELSCHTFLRHHHHHVIYYLVEKINKHLMKGEILSLNVKSNVRNDYN